MSELTFRLSLLSFKPFHGKNIQCLGGVDQQSNWTWLEAVFQTEGFCLEALQSPPEFGGVHVQDEWDHAGCRWLCPAPSGVNFPEGSCTPWSSEQTLPPSALPSLPQCKYHTVLEVTLHLHTGRT